jgi:hypothetical protein
MLFYAPNEIGTGLRPIGRKQQTTVDERPATEQRRLESEWRRAGAVQKPRTR